MKLFRLSVAIGHKARIRALRDLKTALLADLAADQAATSKAIEALTIRLVDLEELTREAHHV